jgi:hypothetical protein
MGERAPNGEPLGTERDGERAPKGKGPEGEPQGTESENVGESPEGRKDRGRERMRNFYLSIALIKDFKRL